MKLVFEDPKVGIEVMDQIALCHEMLSELRRQLRDIEKRFFSLVGEEFGDLTVISKSSVIRIKTGVEIHIPSWRCHCTCGNEIVVSHTDLIEKETDACESCTKEK